MGWAKIRSWFGGKAKQDGEQADEGSGQSAVSVTTPDERFQAMTAQEAASAWIYSTPLDYFTRDGRADVLGRAHDYACMTEEARAAAAEAMSQAITAALEALPVQGRELYDLAYQVTWAIYRSAVDMYTTHADAAEAEPYLKVSARVLYDWLEAHQIEVQFCVNSAYETYDTVFAEYPRYFNACKLVYICAQYMALEMMQQNGLERKDYEETPDRQTYLDNAFFMCRRMQKECAGRYRSYICMDADGNARTYQQTMSYRGKDGHLVVERVAPLRDFSREPRVWYPESVLAAATADEGLADHGAADQLAAEV